MTCIGYALTKILEGRGKLRSISPTDLGNDTFIAMHEFEGFLYSWLESDDEKQVRAARKLLPHVKKILEATEDKYRFANED